jgi:hypothetical protein
MGHPALRDPDLGSALVRYYIFSLRQLERDMSEYFRKMREGWEHEADPERPQVAEEGLPGLGDSHGEIHRGENP